MEKERHEEEENRNPMNPVKPWIPLYLKQEHP